MVTKHFFKVLFIFFLMIALGMASIIIVNSYDDKLAESRAAAATNAAETEASASVKTKNTPTAKPCATTLNC